MLTSEQFNFHLARYAKVKEEDASAFMEAVTQVLLEKVQAGEDVTIQGLGTFVVIDSQQGRRLGFQVDENMRKLVNAPFACFEPMVLAAEMKSLKTETKTPEELETTETQETTEPETAPVSEEPVPVEPVSEEPAIEEPAIEESTEEVPVPEASASEEPVVEDAPATEEPAAEELVLEPAPVAAPGDVATPEPEAKPVAPAPEKPKPTPTRKRYEEEPSLVDQIVKYYKVFKEGKAEPWMWGVLAVVILILILLIWLLIPSGKKEKREVVAPQTVEAPADTTRQDSTVVTETAPEPAKATKSQPAARPAAKKVGKPSDEMLWMENGQPKTGKLGAGGRLTLLALRNYGDKAFWAYIYDVNAYQLGDPNNVPIGKPLYLPDPKYFGIDASDPSSIKKAQVRAMQILREWETK